MKKVLSLLLAFLILASTPLFAFESDAADVKESSFQTIIEKYYDLSYDSELDEKMRDMSDILDMDSMFVKNHLNYLDEIIRSTQYIRSQKDPNMSVGERYPLELSILNLNVNGNQAVAKVMVTGDRSKPYPFFVDLGENVFHFVNRNGKWLISSVQCKDDTLNTMMNEKEFPYVTDEELHKEIDEEYRVQTEEPLEIDENEERHLENKSFCGVPYANRASYAAGVIAYPNRFAINSNKSLHRDGENSINFVSSGVAYGFDINTSPGDPLPYRMVNGIWPSGFNGEFPGWESAAKAQ